jgi:hypothetical protein
MGRARIKCLPWYIRFAIWQKLIKSNSFLAWKVKELINGINIFTR